MLHTSSTLTQRLHAHLLRRHPFVVPAIALAVMALVSGAAYLLISRTKADTVNPNIVIISYDRTQQAVSSREPDVQSLLKKLHIKVNEGDVVEPSLDTPIQQDDFRINIYRAKPIVVVDGGQKTFALSAATTSRSVAEQAGLEVYPEDKITTEPVTDFVASGSISSEVKIKRATPVNVNLYGSKVVLRTHATTVRELLEEKRVKLTDKDFVKPGIDAPISPPAEVAVIRNGLSTVAVEEEIPMPTQSIPDMNLSYGVTAVRQKGAPGKRSVTYEINTQNGIEVSRRALQTVVIQQPVTQISAVGANISGIKGDMARAGIAPGDYQYVDHIVSKESGWCPTKWQGEYGRCPAYHGTPTSASVGYGLCQSTPAWKMASAGADWGTNPVTQLRWCSNYAKSKYGSWAAAYNFWVRNHWW